MANAIKRSRSGRFGPAIAACFLLLAGCSVFDQSPDIAVVRDSGTIEVPVAEIARGNVIKDLETVHEYALLSACIYDGNGSSTNTCVDKENFHGWNLKNYRKTHRFPETPKWSHEIKGFEYDVWEKISDPATPLVAIVFRGTDPKELGDWFSNFRWVTRFIPFIWDQYDQTRDLVPGLVELIQADYGGTVEIVTTGHSLGGGLAQQAAYMSEHIKKVYAFDASVVTGYYSVDVDRRTRNEKEMDIYRIYEHGEVLAYVRWIMKGAYPVTNADPRIVEVRYNIADGGNIISQHGMERFANNLKKIFENATK